MDKKPTLHLFGPIELPEICFLWEARDWRAFGRCPPEGYDWETPMRRSHESRDGFSAKVYGGYVPLSPDETDLAGLPNDPNWLRMIEESSPVTIPYDVMDESGQILDQAKYDEIGKYTWSDQEFEALRDEFENAYEEYIDQFLVQIIQDLHKGNLIAYGTEIDTNLMLEIQEKGAPYDEFPLTGDPAHSVAEPADQVGQIFNWTDWYEDPPIVPIPKEKWISSRVEWDVSKLNGPKISYLWVHLNVDELLELYPPNLIVDPLKTYRLGDNIAVVGTTSGQLLSKKGRPTLPWDQFHVEVARRYAANEMPQKMEAAAADFEGWFKDNLGIKAGKSTILGKLKYYYDALPLKSRKARG